MGIDYNGLELLVRSSQKNVDFSNTLTIGRQEIHLPLQKAQDLLSKNFPQKAANCLQDPTSPFSYSEWIFEIMGAKKVDSMDRSSYESATIIHDLNYKIPNTLRGKFSAIFDGGSLEHIYNFPQAIDNYMEMTALGGDLLILVPCNNFCGHGFYQFSPELFFRIFGLNKNFSLLEIILYEDYKGSPKLLTADPDNVKKRVMLQNSLGTYMWIHARKNQEKSPKESIYAYQSDYIELWNQTKTQILYHESKKSLKSVLKKLLPTQVLAIFLRLKRLLSKNFDSHFYKHL